MFYFSGCKVDLHLLRTQKTSLSFNCTFLFRSISIFPQLYSSPHSLLFPPPLSPSSSPSPSLLPSPSSLPSLPMSFFGATVLQCLFSVLHSSAMSFFGATLFCNVFCRCCTVLQCIFSVLHCPAMSFFGAEQYCNVFFAVLHCPAMSFFGAAMSSAPCILLN